MIDRALIQEIDWILISLLLVNSLCGVVLIYSSSHYLPGNYYLRQIIWIVVSLGVLFLSLTINYKILLTFSLYFYLFLISILFGLLFFGKVIAGAKSWIRVAFLGLQPSELAKIAVILLLARLFSEYKKKYLSLRLGFLSGVVVGLPILLVAKQPDLGTAVSFLSLLAGCLWLVGLNKKTLIVLLIFALLASVAGWNFFLKDYQKKRLTTLIYPGQDPLGSGYHVLQSKIAIGSGGFFGKGFKKGTQSQLKFLPARHTDFIFSVLGEEFGFLGVLFILWLYFLFLSRLFHSVNKSRDRGGVYIVFMVVLMLSFQFFINALMIVGLFPIIGIPLPLLSYGGSSLLTTYLAVGLVINVKMRRFVNV
ncbi:MAG: rod shape-determining protein RodA [Candidatus Aminicenantales bacterium]